MKKTLTTITIATLIIGSIFIFGGQAGAAWLSGWDQRIEITVSNTNIDSDLTHFPLMLKLGTSVGTGSDDVSAIFDEVGSSSQKIAVTKSDGETEIYVEVEKWDDTGEDAILWVSKSDLTLSSSGTTTLYIYYDSTHADNTTYIGNDPDDTPSNNVWDSNFTAVYHMNQSSGSLKDSTDNSNDGTFQGNLPDIARAEKFGKCQDLDGTGDYVTISGSGASNVTRELWAYPDSLSDYGGLLSMSDWATGAAHFKVEGGNAFSWHVKDTGDGIKVTWNVSTGSWYFVAGRYKSDGTTDIWGNTAEQDTGSNTGSLTILDCNMIGNEYDAAREFDGMIDEARLSDVYRSDAWLKATYYSNTDGLVSYGSEELNNTAPTISSVSDTPDPLDIGATTTFSVDWNDTDGEGIKMLICKTDAITASSSPSCDGGEWASNKNDYDMTDPIEATYVVTGSDIGTNNYYAFVCDDQPSCSASDSGTFTVNEGRKTIKLDNYRIKLNNGRLKLK